MEINLNDQYKMLLQMFLLLIAPWILILVGIFSGIENAWYYILSITWFGFGAIFMGLFN